jgi:hypothetical protein
LKAGLGDKELESSFAPTLATIIVAAERKNDFDVADEAYNLLIAYRTTPVSFMLYGRGLIARAEHEGFGRYAPKAAEMFKRAATATEAQRRADPQLKVIELELAEALFMAGDNRNAGLVAQGFRPDSDPAAATDSYRPVAELIAMASDYLGKPTTGRRFPNVSLADEKLPYPELVLQTVLPSGTSARYVLARWDFSSFDRYACTLTGQDRDVVLSLSKHLQRRVTERDEKISDGCPKPN